TLTHTHTHKNSQHPTPPPPSRTHTHSQHPTPVHSSHTHTHTHTHQLAPSTPRSSPPYPLSGLGLLLFAQSFLQLFAPRCSRLLGSDIDTITAALPAYVRY